VTDRLPGTGGHARRIGPGLLEREAVLDVLLRAVAAAATGRGGAAVLTGEAGIGKTSVVRALRMSLDHGVRVLAGACDDLLSPRALGPLREAATGTAGPLAAALAGEPDAVPGAVVAELAAWRPTVLIVEDLHWADDATLDVLGHVARRLGDLPALLVLTFRAEEVSPAHPLRRVLGALTATTVHRLALPPLSSAAVAGLAAGSGRDATALYTLTGGNPFYVTEALAAPGMAVPATVADAVLARVGRLDPACRDAVEQLSVVPTAVELGLARALLGVRFDALADAEEQGVVQVRDDGLAFRHELARRAVEQSLSALRRRTLHRQVIDALAAEEPRDLPRLVHHAVRSDDVEAILAYAPAAGREAAAAGSHRQALAHLEAALRHAPRLPDRERARLHDDYAWELHNAHRHDDAVAESERAVALLTALDEPDALGASLVRLSRHRYLTGDTDGAEDAADAALRTVRPLRSRDALAAAATNRAALVALDGHPDAGEALRQADALARRAGRFDLVALCLNYESLTRTGIDVDERIGLLRASIELAARHGADEAVARGYTNLAEMLYRYVRFAELEEVLGDGLAFTDEHGLPSHAYNLQVHRCLLVLRRGDWADAEAGLEALVDQDDDPGMLAGHSRPPYGRLLARRGVAGAGQLLALAWERALRQRSLLCLAYAGTALVEQAWLAELPDRAAAVLDGWARHATRPSAEPVHAEILRYAARAGLPVEPFRDCPEPWAAGLRGDWRAAAAGWERVGDPYEQALELAASGEPAPTLEALRTLEDLGADAAVRHVRRQLRELGVTRLPRRPIADTRAHPAGLTRRQADVLALIADGLTNAEIADRLVLSVRTVDTHVAAILDRLGVRSRREAAALAQTLDLAAGIGSEEPR
jgi:DNA-binding CsgD family transcriptional regulator/tetratricopeptide (TPR) repeat protein